MSTLVFSPAPSAMSTPTRNDPLPPPIPPNDHGDSRPVSFFPDARTPPSPPKRTMTTPPPRRGSQSPQPPPRRDSAGDASVRRHLTPPPSAGRLLSSQLPSPSSSHQSDRRTRSPSPILKQHRPMSAATESLDSDSPFLAPRSAPSMPLPTLAPLIIHPPSLSTESALSSPASSTRGLLLTPPTSPSRVSTLSPTHTSISSTIVFPLISIPMSVPPSLRPALSPMRYQQILESFQSCYMSHQRQIRFHKCALAFSLLNVFVSYVLVSIRSLRKTDLPLILAYMLVSALFALVATINWYAAYACEEDEAIDVDRRGRQRARRSIWLPPSDTTLDAMWSVARDPVVKCSVVVKITIHGPISLLMAYSSAGAGRGMGEVQVAAPFSPTALSGTTFTGTEKMTSLAEKPPPTTSIMRSSLMSYSSDRQILGPHPPLPTHNRPPSVQSPKLAHSSPRRASASSIIDLTKPQPRYPPANNPVLGGRRPSLVSLLNEGPLVPTQYPKAHTMPLPAQHPRMPTSHRIPTPLCIAGPATGPPPVVCPAPPAKSSRPPLLGDLDLGPSQLLEAIEEASSSLEQAISTSTRARPDTMATSMVEGDSLVALYGATATSLSVIAAQLRMGPWVDAEAAEHAHDWRQRELVRLQEELKQLEMEVGKE
ncbi:hypothetical protein BCR44DRAFT_1422991 [Catenaria anguillulae PL171]|uniref:Uncharacterized protein n=1 Tax=Catenaria anguillulae PL171 TaxID=765915 RepID=A0A1Y2I662_9FUNG|nr:hypothetical protein BCR44DRAFT_1422991 [Catenaria anguillulae PL171]